MKSTNSQARGYAFVLMAATFWGTLGIFYKILIERFHFTPLAVASYRSLFAGVILLILLTISKSNRLLLRVHRRDWLLFASYGVIGVAGFYLAYAYAIDLVGVSVAAVLLYTAPAWVALIAWGRLGEKLDRRVVFALALTLAGSVLVSGLYDFQIASTNWIGILAGLGAGLGYGLWSIFNKVAVQRYSVWTVQLYALLIGSAIFFLYGLPTANLSWKMLDAPEAWAWLFTLALLPTLGGALSFSLGVRWVPVSVASIVATLEPVIATALAYILLGERLTVPQMTGGALIVSAVILLRPRAKN